MKKIIITGSNGFLGSHIAEEFSRNSWHVTGIDRRPGSQKTECKTHISHIQSEVPSIHFDEILLSQQPELLIHAAGPSSVSDSIKNPLQDFEGSIMFFFNVLDAIRRCSPQTRLIFLSSAAVYGNPTTLPISETAPRHPISPYGFHKMICEKLIEEFFTIYKIRSCSARIFSSYGPGQKKMVLWDISRKALEGSSVNLFGSGKETRDLIHTTDLSRCIRLIAENGSFSAESYNIGNGVELSISTLAKEMVHALGTNNDIVFNQKVKEGDPLRWCADISRIQALGYRSTVSLTEGLQGYAEWVKSQ
ncbi:NAD-dependent epimerase/dehydratase family protein [Methanoregula sp.]|uniref:NAD-dependent epimerase/dehydratase family protein n=1 Tax=Methanoregula sp. TaxID=2052170 RepID=UPI003C3295F9